MHGNLQENVYLSIPEGISSLHNTVCKLQKSLYGLKQASMKWYEKLTSLLMAEGYTQSGSYYFLLTSLLIAEGYTQSGSYYFLFTHQQGCDFTALLVYLDDITLVGSSLTEFARIKSILDSHFRIKDLGVLKYFLGLEVAHSKRLEVRMVVATNLSGCSTILIFVEVKGYNGGYIIFDWSQYRSRVVIGTIIDWFQYQI